MNSRIVVAVAATLWTASLAAQAPGFRLFQEVGGLTTLLDLSDNAVHTWPGLVILTAHVEADGSLVRGMQAPSPLPVLGSTGKIQRLDFDGTLLWDYDLAGPFYYANHDIEPMPNGNVLVAVRENYTVADAIAQGRDPALITGTYWLPGAILEIQPTGPTTGTIVWEWHMIDHVVQDFDSTKPNYGVVGNHPELLDINYPPTQLTTGNFNHFNGIDYDPVNDWIVISSLRQTEIYIIDHSTTSAQAAGHTGGLRGKGGDLLYRWGNPEAYRAGPPAIPQLGGQHDPRFVPPGYPGEGRLTLFNNGYGPSQSAVHELELPLDASGNFVLDPALGYYGPATPAWTFTEPGMYSPIMSSAERLPNGNTLIAVATQSRLLEVTQQCQVVWDYQAPSGSRIFQAHYVDRMLWADTNELSVSGGQVDFDHLAGSAFAGDFHMLLGSLSGTTPGTPVPGGRILPLNSDFLTVAMASNFNSGPFVNTVGPLDASGAGASSIVAGPGLIPPALIGTNMDFAYLVFDNSLLAGLVSNTVPVTIVP